jgi:hypothetical protein
MKLVSNEILAVRKIKNAIYRLSRLGEKQCGSWTIQRSEKDEMGQEMGEVTISQVGFVYPAA